MKLVTQIGFVQLIREPVSAFAADVQNQEPLDRSNLDNSKALVFHLQNRTRFLGPLPYCRTPRCGKLLNVQTYDEGFFVVALILESELQTARYPTVQR